jgi:hypothetical protein
VASSDDNADSAASRWCEFICDVHVCSPLCCFLDSASPFVTFTCVICTLRSQISRPICNFTHKSHDDYATLHPLQWRRRWRPLLLNVTLYLPPPPTRSSGSWRWRKN